MWENIVWKICTKKQVENSKIYTKKQVENKGDVPMPSKELKEEITGNTLPETEQEQNIRFVDSTYKELFTIKDNESIVITRADGEEKIFQCRYIDDYHALIGTSVMHIGQFAQFAKKNKLTYRPLEEREKKNFEQGSKKKITTREGR